MAKKTGTMSIRSRANAMAITATMAKTMPTVRVAPNWVTGRIAAVIASGSAAARRANHRSIDGAVVRGATKIARTPTRKKPIATMPTRAAERVRLGVSRASGAWSVACMILPERRSMMFTDGEKRRNLRLMDTHPAAWTGGGFRERRPVVAAIVIAMGGAVLMGLVLVALGLSLTEGLLSGPLGRWDESVNDWFVAHRTPVLNDVAHVGSIVAMTLPVIAVAAIAAAVFLVLHRFRAAGFLLVALAVESSVFLVTTLVVERTRPTVPRLEPSPPTSSFPSGHTAAATVLYVGLALVLTPNVRARWLRVLIWLVAIAIPVFVATSRVYAGMHHVTDIAGSIVLAAGALATGWIAVGGPGDEAT